MNARQYAKAELTDKVLVLTATDARSQNSTKSFRRAYSRASESLRRARGENAVLRIE